MTEHPITPPPELIGEWVGKAGLWEGAYEHDELFADIATQAARWGADQELEACCHLLRQQGFDVVDDLRATRRPKPPSLKQQALDALQRAEEGWRPIPDDCDTIRRALEQLDD